MQQAQAKFQARGIKLVGISYDNEKILREFGQRFNITYSLLADPQSEIIRSFGLVNPDNGPENRPDYAKKDMAFPGFIYVDKTGTVKEKFLGGMYFDRYTANNMLGKLFPELLETAGGSSINSPHLNLTLKQSDRQAVIGNRVTLAVEISLPKGMHLYAPGVKGGYKAVQLVIEQSEGVRLKDSNYPLSRIMLLPAINERVPIYEGKIRISQDVMIFPNRKFQESLAALGEDRNFHLPMTIHGKLVYQACDAKVCYLPMEVPVSWELQIFQTDQKRVRDEIQDHP